MSRPKDSLYSLPIRPGWGVCRVRVRIRRRTLCKNINPPLLRNMGNPIMIFSLQFGRGERGGEIKRKRD
jgi:hypothetical protein